MAATPFKLKNLNVFQDGVSFLGETVSFTEPKLGRETEEYRGGGMGGKVKVPMGLQPLELEWSLGGLRVETLRAFGIIAIDGVMLRFAGAYQDIGNAGAVTAIEIVTRGFHEELDNGEAKAGESTEHKVKSSLSYYKKTVNGRVEAEIDLINMIEIIDGVDRMAAIRQAIGG